MIGIIGQGFVGNAVYQSFKDHFTVRTYDIDSSRCNSTLKEVHECNVIFLCLPTPMNDDGSCDVSILEDVLDNIPVNKIVVIKSTVPPRVVRQFEREYRLRLVFNPEFLTAANAVVDFRNQDRIILGSNDTGVIEVGKIYKKIFNCPIYYCDSVEAMMCKYIVNTFLALKVSFANEIFDFCQKNGINYEEAVKLAILDKRVGESHWQVPGPDGERGFGGACFPKDINALIYEFGDEDATILNAAWNKNLRVR